MAHCFTRVLLAAVFSASVVVGAAEPSTGGKEHKWTVPKAQDWYRQQPWMVGCNFLPSTAINQVEMFQPETYDPETIKRELGWAKDLGFNTLRIFLHDILWQDEVRKGFLKNFDNFLGICQSKGMRCIIVFFDDCHWDHDIRLGKQQPRITGVHNSGWFKCPGRKLLRAYADRTISDRDKARLKSYVQDLVRRYGKDARIVMWDIYNEPRDPHARSLLTDAWAWAREANPSQPLTGCVSGSGQDYCDLQGSASDIVTYHCYNFVPDGQARTIAALKKTYPGRPLVCTEYMVRPAGTFQKCLPILKKNNVGAISWGLVNGKSGTVWGWPSQKRLEQIVARPDWSMAEIERKIGFDQPARGENYPEPRVWFHDIFRVDGTPFDPEEVTLIREITHSRRATEAAASSPRAPVAAPDKRTDAGRFMTRWAKDVTPENAWAEYPRPALVRPKWLNLNGLWDYAIVGPTGLPEPASAINAETDPLLKATPVPPATWDGTILVPFVPESPLSKVSRFVWPRQLLWYHRTVKIPDDWQGQRLILHFEAVDWHCLIQVNGRTVGEHKGGYAPFAFDVTEAVKPQGSQDVMLVVWDPNGAGDQAKGKQNLPRAGNELTFPSSSGIWQSVWLEPVSAVSIERLVATPDLDRSAVAVHVELRGEQAEFDDGAWAASGVPLALKSIPDPCTTPHLYARRIFTLDALPKRAALRVDGWATFTVWLNGRRIKTLTTGRTESYAPVSLALLAPEALAALRPGRNVLAVEIGPSGGRLRRPDWLDLNSLIDMDFGLFEVKTRD